jgi:hypothetical protein
MVRFVRLLTSALQRKDATNAALANQGDIAAKGKL